MKQAGVMYIIMVGLVMYILCLVEGTMVKQADVILIGFPLMYNMSTDVRRNDLLSYEHVIALIITLSISQEITIQNVLFAARNMLNLVYFY